MLLSPSVWTCEYVPKGVDMCFPKLVVVPVTRVRGEMVFEIPSCAGRVLNQVFTPFTHSTTILIGSRRKGVTAIVERICSFSVRMCLSASRTCSFADATLSLIPIDASLSHSDSNYPSR